MRISAILSLGAGGLLAALLALGILKTSAEALIFAGCALAGLLLFDAVERYGRRHGIAEARFDSETGKQIVE